MALLDELIKEEYIPPTQEDAQESPKDTKVKKDKIFCTANFSGLCDLVEVDETVAFLTMQGTIQNEVILKGKTYLPPEIDKVAFELPSYKRILQAKTEVSEVITEVSKTTFEANTEVTEVTEGLLGSVGAYMGRLFDEIEQYHRDSAELPDERLYTLITAWDIHTHFLERFEYSPIIFFAGLPEKGKSRMAKSMIAIAKRGLIKASVSDAQIIREASDQGATIFFDMTDFWNSISKSGSEDVILSRYERGLKVSRVLNPEKGPFRDTTYFDVFGPTIIASNEDIQQVLGSRTVTVIMKQSKRTFEKPINKEKAKELQAKIIALKLLLKDKDFPTTPKIAPGRFGDIIQPLHMIVKYMNPKKEADFISLIEDIEKEKKIIKSQTVEGEIVQAILSLSSNVQRSFLLLKDITMKINEDRSEREKIDSRTIGRRLAIMGYQKTRIYNGSTAIHWNSTLNELLASEHNVNTLEENDAFSVSSITSVTSVTSVTNNSNNNKTISNDIIEETKKIFEEKQEQIPF